MKAGEGFETIQRIGLLKHFCIQFNRRVRGVDAGVPACGFLISARMRRAVGAEKKLFVATGGGLDQREPMRFALQDRPAVMMWSQSAVEERVAIEQQMMSRDCAADQRRCVAHELHGVPCRDVFDDHAQAGKPSDDGSELAVKEDGLTIKHVDAGIGSLGMH